MVAAPRGLDAGGGAPAPDVVQADGEAAPGGLRREKRWAKLRGVRVSRQTVSRHPATNLNVHGGKVLASPVGRRLVTALDDDGGELRMRVRGHIAAKI